MLIIVPPSETKRSSPADGPPVDLGALSFPELTPLREQVVEALIETSRGADAFRRLMVKPSMADEVARNTWVRELPAGPVLELYSGPMHVGLDASSLSPAAAARAEEELVVASALWGLLRPADRVPTYRLHMDSHLVGIDRLDATWRTLLPDVLATAAGCRGVVVDLRSPYYQAAGLPRGLGDRTVALRVGQHAAGGRRIGDVIAKRTRGEAAHALLECAEDPVEPGELAELLGDRWPVRLVEPEAPGKPWTMTLSVDA